jgi:hypothetical protein
MKKSIVFFCLILVLNVSAQIKKGSWMLGGTANGGMMRLAGNTGEVLDFKGHTFNFRPEIGYFASSKLAVGARFKVNFMDFHYARNSQNFGLSYFTWKDRSYEFAPFIRYYFYTKRAFNFYYQFNMSGEFSRSQVSSSSSPDEPLNKWTEYPIFYLSSSLGLDYFLTKNVALETDWNYQFYYETKDDVTQQPYRKRVFPKLSFTPEFKIKLFLNTDKSSPKLLADKYLKKGNVTFGFEGALRSDYQSVSLTPSMGYFLTNKWLIGSSLTVFYQKDNRFYVGIAPEMRFYQPITKNMQLLLRGASWAGVSVLSDDRSTQFDSGEVNLEIGLNKFIAENISIYGVTDLGVGLWKDKLNLRPFIRFGFQYFMNETYR